MCACDCVFGLLRVGACVQGVCVCERWETSLLGSDLENVSLSSRFLKNRKTKRRIDIKLIAELSHFNKESGTMKLLHH